MDNVLSGVYQYLIDCGLQAKMRSANIIIVNITIRFNNDRLIAIIQNIDLTVENPDLDGLGHNYIQKVFDINEPESLCELYKFVAQPSHFLPRDSNHLSTMRRALRMNFLENTGYDRKRKSRS